jgi:hypothetical protein
MAEGPEEGSAGERLAQEEAQQVEPPLIVRGLAKGFVVEILAQQSGITVVGEASNGREAIVSRAGLRPMSLCSTSRCRT